MTLINAWPARRGARGDEVEQQLLVSCDGCLPPKVHGGFSAEVLADAGWKIEQIDSGPHLCPVCAPKRLRREPRRRGSAQPRPALPNLLIIGAGKSGTTSLHRYLGEHPQIHMSEPKELRFFVDPSCLERLDSYATFFDRSAPVRGESSPVYSIEPVASGVADRVRAAIPDAKLIYLVRDPVERIVSAYLEVHAHLSFLPCLEDAIGDLDDSHNLYLASSRYATQLEAYLRVFPQEQIMVVDQAELLSDRRGTLRGVFRFLGVDEDYWSPAFDVRRNSRERTVQWSVTGSRLAESRLAAGLRRVVPERPRRALFAPAKRLTTTKLEAPTMGDELRERLRGSLRGEAERLRELTGQPFETWQV